MPTTDIAPLCESLARDYGVIPAKTKSDFSVGHLFGIRSTIVHSGQPLSRDFQVNGLVAAVVVNVLLELVGQPHLHRTKGIVLDGQSNPSAAISP
jgi:hypothetical protein